VRGARTLTERLQPRKLSCISAICQTARSRHSFSGRAHGCDSLPHAAYDGVPV